MTIPYLKRFWFEQRYVDGGRFLGPMRRGFLEQRRGSNVETMYTSEISLLFFSNRISPRKSCSVGIDNVFSVVKAPSTEKMIAPTCCEPTTPFTVCTRIRDTIRHHSKGNAKRMAHGVSQQLARLEYQPLNRPDSRLMYLYRISLSHRVIS